MFTARCEKCQNPSVACFCGKNEILPEDIWNEDKKIQVKIAIKYHKSIQDLLDKYKSWLQEEKVPKLGKTISQEKVIDLTARIEVLEELKNKLK